MRLRLLLNRNYASVILIVSVIGAGCTGCPTCCRSSWPRFAGYNAEQAGGIMLLSGLPAFLMMPVLPRLLGKVDSRWLRHHRAGAFLRQLHARHQPDHGQRGA